MNASLAIPSLPLLAHARAVGAAAPVAGSAEPAHLVFAVGGKPYACSITGLEKLLRLADVKVWPAPENFPGLAGLLEDGGHRVPIVCLAALWNLSVDTAAPAPTRSLLVLKTEGDRCALLVDACLGVLKSLPPQSTRLVIPAALTAGCGLAFESMMPWGQELLVKVRLEKLLPAELRDRIQHLAGGGA